MSRSIKTGAPLELSRNSIREMAKGQLYRVPGYAAALDVYRRIRPRKASARYCYSVWLRHLVAARENGLEPKLNVAMELGPGDSIGCGLAALLSGAERYVVVDWVRYTNVASNVDVLDELRQMFDSQAPIPDDDEFPEVNPKLQSYAFPRSLITAPGEAKVRRIRQALSSSSSGTRDGGPDSERSCISYFAPYRADDVVMAGDVDFLFSQAVMEHVDEPDALYRATNGWLKPGGIASHTIDYRCHSTSSRWNGHWTYSDTAWKLIRGRKAYLLNRLAHSAHRKLLTDSRFDIVAEVRERAQSEVLRSELAPRFRELTDDDLTTATGLFQAIKR